jgi:hypothetical protein
MTRSLVILVAVAACGNPAHRGGGDDDAPLDAAADASADAAPIDAPSCDPGTTWCDNASACVDEQTANDHCGDCTTACDSGSTCSAGTCKPGHGATANGTCTYIDQPGWLSCPEGMSCQCYYHYYKLFMDSPAHLDAWISDTEVDITGGTIPQNQTLYSVPAAMIPIANGSGNVYPYQVTVGAAVTIKIDAFSGYVPANDVLFGDADCGNEGKILQCTFAE